MQNVLTVRHLGFSMIWKLALVALITAYLVLMTCPVNLAAKGFFLEPLSSQCIACIANCDSCQDAQTCSLCSEGYFEDSIGSCLPCIENCSFCITRDTCDYCIKGYYMSSEGSCVLCHQNCTYGCLNENTCQPFYLENMEYLELWFMPLIE